MSTVKHFIKEALKRTDIDEFFMRKLENAGYGGATITKTPLGTHIVIYATRPGLVIGRGGRIIKELVKELEERFGISNPQIAVAEVEVPELNPYIMASRIASALRRGIHYRRAGFWALNRIMEAGALGAEIVISGKLRSQRAKYEKFKAGYIPKCGEPAVKYLRKAVIHVQLKPGVYGVKVLIMPPDAQFSDRVTLKETPPEIEAGVEGEAEGAVKEAQAEPAPEASSEGEETAEAEEGAE